MSVELVLVPLAFAAISAWKASRTESDGAGPTVCHVSTRMRDQGLLAAALSDCRADVAQHDGSLVANWEGVSARFARDHDGIWQVHLTGDVDEQRAVGIVEAVDGAYGLRVQQAVLAKLKKQAPAAGMTVASERVEDDDSVTLVLNVGQGA